MQAQSSVRTSGLNLSTAMERLSSGVRINSAKDDAAGLAITARMTASIRGISAAIRNANDGISLTQTAEGSLGQIGDNLQRIRELAVQSANTGNNASDRAAMNNEAKQLVAEIDRIASNTTYNNIALLDGTFQAQNLQVGAGNGSNDRIAISIGSAKSSALGVGSNSSYAASTVGVAVGSTALAASALNINGYSTGAAVDDGVSYTLPATSGIAVAAAINAISANTNVTASVGETTTVGTAPLAPTTVINDGDVLINGVSIGAIAAATTAVGRGGQVAAAVNAVSTQTGVTATFDTTTGAVALEATDGRNITVTSSVTSHATGLASGVTSTMAAPSNASTSTASLAEGDLTINGFDVAAIRGTALTINTTDGVADTSDEVAEVTFTDLDAGESATLNGLTFTATADMLATDVGEAFANLTSGMTATAASAANTTSAALGTYSGTFTAGWTTGANTAGVVDATSTTADTDVDDIVGGRFANLVGVINNMTDDTGVTATLDAAGKISLSSTTGIVLTGNTASVTGISGTLVVSDTANATTSRSLVTLSTTDSAGINISGSTAAALTAAGLVEGSATVTATAGAGVSSIDLTTAAGSQAALTTLDSAIDTITNSRASMGAYQNRLTASIANLETTSMNLSASRSRILDTDYAKETTNLAKSQIIQQAATAMLAQANQSGQSVLALLK